MERDRYRPILNNGVYEDHTLEQARTEVAWYKECGYSGFAINGRSRKPVSDLKEWLPDYLNACRNFVQAAKEQEMNVWIFDEWGFPSGTACGQVLTEERFRAKKYRICYDVLLEKGETISLPLPERFVSACVFPVDYFDYYSPKDKGTRIRPDNDRLCFTADEKTRLVAVCWEYLTFVTHTMKKKKEDDPTIGTIDILSREAVAKFLNCMHEWYVEPLGEEFGKTVQGFFYDEPEICYDFPYTEALSEAFLNMHGYALEDILPEVMAWKANSAFISINDAIDRRKQQFADYNRTWNDLLAKNFYGQIRDWCHEHGLLSVGHQDLDNQLETLRSVSGDFWENSKYNDRPGIDVIWDQIVPDHFDDFARYAGCAKRTMKSSGAMSETFAEMGPSMYPDRMRYTMEQQILRGVDQFFLYTNYDREDLNVKHFAKAVNDRVTQTAELCNRGRAGAETAIYIPMDQIAFWANHKDPHFYNSKPLIWEQINSLAETLCYHPVDYDYAWQGTLDTLLERGIHTLLLTGQELNAEEADDARAFVAGGGHIICIGKPCLQLEEISEYYPKVADWLKEQKQELSLSSINGRPLRISMTTRIMEEGSMYFLLNESDAPADVACKASGDSVRDSAGGGAWNSAWNSASGTEGDTCSWSWSELDQNTGSWKVSDMETLSFEPRELKIFRRESGADKRTCNEKKNICQGGLAEVAAGASKACVSNACSKKAEQILTEWKFSVPNGKVMVLNADGLGQLPPWTQLDLGNYTGFASYETSFFWEGGVCELNLGEVRFSAIVRLDGETIPLPLAPHRLRRELSPGNHMLQIEVLNSNANRIYGAADQGRGELGEMYWMKYQFERAYMDCGLIGPVKVVKV